MTLGRLRHDLQNNDTTVCLLEEEMLQDVADKDIPWLVRLLTNKNINVLYVNGLKVSDTALKQLPELINSLQLECFSFACSNIGDMTVEAFVAALRNNTSLKRLNLVGNKITDPALKMFGAALKDHKILQKFCIGGLANVSDQSLIEFSLLTAQNIYFHSDLSNGFIHAPFHSSATLISFLNQFFLKIIERNQAMALQKSFQEKIKIYNTFSGEWNEKLKVLILPPGTTPESFTLSLWRNLKKPYRLVDTCLFSVIEGRANKKITAVMPCELEERAHFLAL